MWELSASVGNGLLTIIIMAEMLGPSFEVDGSWTVLEYFYHYLLSGIIVRLVTYHLSTTHSIVFVHDNFEDLGRPIYCALMFPMAPLHFWISDHQRGWQLP